MLGSQGLGLGSVGTAAQIGGGNALTPVLAAVYLAGAGDVPNDDVFAMPSGNLRFLGDAGAAGVPGVALYESATTPGDSRFASWYTRRFMPTGAGVGQTIGDSIVGYDPAWDGSFSKLSGIALTFSRAGYTNVDDQTGASMALHLGDLSWQSESGFFQGPITQPTPGVQAGSVETLSLDLYQNGSTPSAVRNAFTWSGWGQMVMRPMALFNGITAAIDMRGEWQNVVTAAGDGLGLIFRDFDNGTPLAMLDAHMLTTDASADYGLGFWAKSAGVLSKIATFDWTNGIVFNAPVSTFSGGRSVQTFQSPLLDLTQVSSSTLVLQVAGFRFIPQNFGFVCATASGVTGNPTVQADVGATNLLPSQAFTAASTVVPNQRTLSLTLASPLIAPDMGSAGLVFQVTAGATATALTGRFFVTGALAPL